MGIQYCHAGFEIRCAGAPGAMSTRFALRLRRAEKTVKLFEQLGLRGSAHQPSMILEGCTRTTCNEWDAGGLNPIGPLFIRGSRFLLSLLYHPGVIAERW